MKEIWKNIPGYKGKYQVSDQGRVKGIRVRHMQTPKATNGYPVVMLYSNGYRKTALVHRLVALAFLPRVKNKPHVNHKNGVRYHNVVTNLEWCDNKGNHQHAAAHGRKAKGEKNGNYKLKDAQIKRVRSLIRNGVRTGVIAAQFNVSRDLIYKIKIGVQRK